MEYGASCHLGEGAVLGFGGLPGEIHLVGTVEGIVDVQVVRACFEGVAHVAVGGVLVIAVISTVEGEQYVIDFNLTRQDDRAGGVVRDGGGGVERPARSVYRAAIARYAHTNVCTRKF